MWINDNSLKINILHIETSGSFIYFDGFKHEITQKCKK